MMLENICYQFLCELGCGEVVYVLKMGKVVYEIEDGFIILCFDGDNVWWMCVFSIDVDQNEEIVIFYNLCFEV